MSNYPEPTPAELADYDQVHANTTAYLDILVKTLRVLIDQGITRDQAVVGLYDQLLNPDPATDLRLHFQRDDLTQMLAVAVDQLEPGWPA